MATKFTPSTAEKIQVVKSDSVLLAEYNKRIAENKIQFCPMKINGKKVGVQKFNNAIKNIAVQIFNERTFKYI